ncbi:PAS domain-containing protein [Archangium sp.]|jgi:PAS domain S-box-containing protein|uniref:sensor histidine kinase n=1 Tax=Archangium sp. TaxID=1872627 RepID=UPI002EDB24E5
MPKVADFIENHRASLVERFVQEAGKLESARGLKRYELIDNLPEYLATLATLGREGDRGALAKTKKRLQETHIALRLRHGYHQEDATSEYVLLGRLISSLWEALPREEQPTAEDTGLLFAQLQDALDQVVVTFSGYSLEDRQREKRTLRRLDALAPESLGRAENPVALRERLMPLVEVIQEALGADGAELLLVDVSGTRLESVAVTGVCPPPPAEASVPLDAPSFLAEVAKSEEPLYLPDAVPARGAIRDEVGASGLHSLLGLRLWPHGKLLGVLWVGVKQTRSFEPQAWRYLETLVEHLAGILDRALLFEELREANTQLRAQQELLTAVLEQMPTAVFLAEAPSGKLIYGNRQVAETLGHPFRAASDMSEYGQYAVHHPDGRPFAPEEYPMVRAIQKGERVEREEVHYKRGDGTWSVLHLSAAPIRDSQGRIILGVVSVGDLTEQKRAEEALAQMDALVAGAPIPVALLDTDLRYVRLNEAMATANGLPVQAHLGRTVDEVIPDRAGLIAPLLRQVLATGEALRGVEFTDITASAPGVSHHWLADFFPVRMPRGRVLGLGCIVMDITERKQQEEKVRQAAEFRERFLGIVSHDLRNPLNVILMSAQGLLREAGLSERATRSAQRIATSAERMGRMIADLLDFTRGRLGGGIPITLRSTHLGQLCRRLLDEMKALHPTRELVLREDGDLHAEVDPDRVAQLVGNLVKNALDYSPAGTPVTLSLHGEEKFVRLEVHNHGPPVPAEVLPVLFEPFRRGRQGEKSSHSGLGLGLFIVQQIVASHGSTVEARSTQEEGTTFIVRLPRVSEAAGPVAPV